MNQTSKKRKRPSKYLVVMSVVLSVLCMGLLVFDVLQCREANLQEICLEKESYLEAMAYSGNFAPEALIDYIKETYPTSASDYGFVAVDDEILFMRDDNYTKSLKETDTRAYFGISEHSAKVEGSRNAYAVFLSGTPWYVIFHEEIVQDKEITVGICISREYLISQSDFDILLQHSVLYLALFSVAFVVSVFFLAHREKENENMENELKEQLVENRRLIERLGERLEAQSGTDYQRENGFCRREIVEQIMQKLTPEQKEKSRKITVRMKENTPQAIVNYSVLLERMKVNKSVCCLWENEEFLILLLNTDEEGATNFVKQFLLQYQKMFRSDATDIQISVREW
ncbi:MAG: hypothetical protein E7289_08475 [Lachnospiraceae bacterium]|nr:hypothetical protein [Lachnospiraceae bacterium]